MVEYGLRIIAFKTKSNHDNIKTLLFTCKSLFRDKYVANVKSLI
jgi:hypothetical protein